MKPKVSFRVNDAKFSGTMKFNSKLNALFSGLDGKKSYRIQHVMYLTRLLLDCLLNHRYNKALECLVGLCGACRRIPELFWRVS